MGRLKMPSGQPVINERWVHLTGRQSDVNNCLIESVSNDSVRYQWRDGEIYQVSLGVFLTTWSCAPRGFFVGHRYRRVGTTNDETAQLVILQDDGETLSVRFDTGRLASLTTTTLLSQYTPIGDPWIDIDSHTRVQVPWSTSEQVWFSLRNPASMGALFSFSDRPGDSPRLLAPVESRLAVLPENPRIGERYLLIPAEGLIRIAEWAGFDWFYLDPAEDSVVYVRDVGRVYQKVGTSWSVWVGPSVDPDIMGSAPSIRVQGVRSVATALPENPSLGDRFLLQVDAANMLLIEWRSQSNSSNGPSWAWFDPAVGTTLFVEGLNSLWLRDEVGWSVLPVSNYYQYSQCANVQRVVSRLSEEDRGTRVLHMPPESLSESSVYTHNHTWMRAAREQLGWRVYSEEDHQEYQREASGWLRLTAEDYEVIPEMELLSYEPQSPLTVLPITGFTRMLGQAGYPATYDRDLEVDRLIPHLERYLTEPGIVRPGPLEEIPFGTNPCREVLLAKAPQDGECSRRDFFDHLLSGDDAD